MTDTLDTNVISRRERMFNPAPIQSVADTGISSLWLEDLALKILYFSGYMTGFKVAEAMALPFPGITDILLTSLKQDKLVEIKSSQGGLGEGAYTYAITGAGIARAREALERSQYAGPTPVPLKAYNDAIRKQTRGRTVVNDRVLRQSLSQLVLNEQTLEKVGPAVNSGTSIFMYGPPGNGKTSIARSIGNLVSRGTMFIPYAIFVEGQVVTLFDNVNHQLAPEENTTQMGTGTLKLANKRDSRWVQIRRPFIVTGGELTLSGLDLVFDDVNKFYEAPFQVKANGGIFLID